MLIWSHFVEILKSDLEVERKPTLKDGLLNLNVIHKQCEQIHRMIKMNLAITKAVARYKFLIYKLTPEASLFNL